MSKERSRRIFAFLTKELGRVTSEFAGRILCPLCMKAFPEQAIDTGELTQEHVIPGELGGKLLTLTCKPCNNTHGTQLDAHLVQMLRSHDAFWGLGDTPFRGGVDARGLRIPAAIDWRLAQNATTVFRLRAWNPTEIARFRQNLRSTNRLTVDLSFNFIPNRAHLAVMRIAYLATFKWLGYGYILSDAGQVMRELLWQVDTPPIQLGKIVAEANNISPAPEEPVQFLRISNLSAVGVMITLVADSKRHFLTFMPSPEIPRARVFEVLAEAAAAVAKLHPIATA